MSHFSVLVITKKGQSSTGLLEPYDENIEVASHAEKCFCSHRNLNAEVERRLTEHFGGSFDTVFRAPYNALSVEEQAALSWREHIKPWLELEAHLADELFAEFCVPNPACADCHGTGVYLSTYNPNSKWDWYVLGGRWIGTALTLLPGRSGKLGEPGAGSDVPEPGKVDQAFVRDVDLAQLEMTFAFITPNGLWHEQAEMGWWGMTSNEREDAYKKEWDEMLKSLTPDDLLSVYDCHI